MRVVKVNARVFTPALLGADAGAAGGPDGAAGMGGSAHVHVVASTRKLFVVPVAHPERVLCSYPWADVWYGSPLARRWRAGLRVPDPRRMGHGRPSRLRVGLGGQSVLVYLRAREHNLVTADAERTWSLLRLLAQNPALHACRLQVRPRFLPNAACVDRALRPLLSHQWRDAVRHDAIVGMLPELSDPTDDDDDATDGGGAGGGAGDDDGFAPGGGAGLSMDGDKSGRSYGTAASNLSTCRAGCLFVY